MTDSLRVNTSKNPAREKLCEFLKAAFPRWPDDPVTLVVGEGAQEIEQDVSTTEDIEAFVKNAGDEPIYVRPIAGGRVAFLHAVERTEDPDAWRDFTLKPTVALHCRDLMLLLYRLDEAEAATAGTARLLSLMGGEGGDLIPTPGANGWAVVHLDPEAFVTLDALAAAYGDAGPAPEIAPGQLGTWHDATICTPFDPDDPMLARRIVIHGARSAEAKRWKPRETTLREVLGDVCKHHPQDSKDGPAVVLAKLSGLSRTAAEVEAVEFAALDLDTGADGAELRRLVGALGMVAVMASTHSHLKTQTRAKLDSVVRWARSNGLGKAEIEAQALGWLASKHEAHVCEGATVEVEVGPQGRQCVISHAPIPKWRVFFPLAAPYVIAEAAPTDEEARRQWATFLRALAAKLGGVMLDRAALDVSRLFYLPAHAPGRPHETYLFGGELLDAQTLLAEPTQSPAEGSAGALAREYGGAADAGAAEAYEGPFDKRWAARRANGLGIRDLIEACADEKIRARIGSKLTVECPEDHLHSNPGDPDDKGCYVQDAGDGLGEGFVWHCSHDGCAGRDRLHRMNAAWAAGWFRAEEVETHDTLDRTGEDDDDDAADETVTEREAVERRLDARHRYEAAIDALTPDSTDDAVNEACEMLILANPATRPYDDARRLLAKRLDKGVKVVDGMLAERRAYVWPILDALDRLARREADKAEAEKAAKKGAKFAELEREIPLPHPRYGKHSYAAFDGRPWVIGTIRRDGESYEARLWTPWAIVGGLEYPDRRGAKGVRFRAQDESGAVVEFDLPASATVEPRELRAALRSRGVLMTKEGMEWLSNLAAQMQPKDPLRVFDRPGWRDVDGGRVFITPWGRVIGRDGTEGATLDRDKRPPGAEVAGDLGGWRKGAKAAFDSGVLHFQVGILAGLASPVVDLADLASVWVALTGPTSLGKTTGLRLMASAWGETALKRGLCGSFLGTYKSAEALLERSSGAGFAYDEHGLIDGRILQLLIFAAAGGGGADRLDRAAQLQNSRRWSLVVMLSGETGVAAKVRSAGAVAAGGIGARVLDLDVSDAPALTPEQIAEIEAVFRNHGHAGPELVGELIQQGYDRDPERLAVEVHAKAVTLAGPGAQPVRVRAAGIAAVLWRVGELAQDAGLIPADFDLAAMAADLWARAQAADGAAGSAADDAISSLFESLIRYRGVGVAEGSFPDNRPAVAYRLESLKDQRDGRELGEVYVVLRSHLQELSGGALDANAMTRALAAAGYLHRPRQDGEWVWGYVAAPGLGRMRAVVIKAEVVESEAAEPDAAEGAEE